MAGRRATSTIQRRRVGSFLRTLRESRDPVVLSKDAAAHIGVDATRLGRIERGRYRITPEQVSGLLDLYGVTDRVTHEELCRATLEDPTSHWWYAYRKKITSSFMDFVALEDEATTIRLTSSTGIPGLLQCVAYAREMQATAMIKDVREKADALFSVRMARQQVITRLNSPARIIAIFPESALLPENPVMEEQVNHLIAMSNRPNVEIRIVDKRAPLSTCHPGTFSLMSFNDPWPMVVHMDSPYGGTLDESKDFVSYTEEVFSTLEEYALDQDSTREFLKDRTGKRKT